MIFCRPTIGLSHIRLIKSNEEARMPIKNLSEIRRLPRAGKIHLGIKKESPRTGNPYPEATDYLVCPEEVRAVYSDKPTELKIVFPTEDAPQQWLKRYSSLRGLVCRGDGERAVATCDLKTGEIATRETENTILKEVICNPETCAAYKAKQCRPIMTLQFLLPDVPGALGVYQVDTSSFNSIVNINSTLELLKSCGRVSMIPLTLKLVPQQAQADGKKKTIHVLQLVAPYTFQELLNLVGRSAKEIFLLPAAEEPPEDIFPDEVITEPAPNPTQEFAPVVIEWQKLRDLQKKINELPDIANDPKKQVTDAHIKSWFTHKYPDLGDKTRGKLGDPPKWATTEMIEDCAAAMTMFFEKNQPQEKTNQLAY